MADPLASAAAAIAAALGISIGKDAARLESPPKRDNEFVHGVETRIDEQRMFGQLQTTRDHQPEWVGAAENGAGKNIATTASRPHLDTCLD